MTNQKDAFTKLANRIVRLHFAKEQIARYKATEVIRTYHAERNEVHDKESGLKLPYKEIVGKNNIAPMVEARKKCYAIL